MNDYETIYNYKPNERLVINTARLISYIKKNIDIDILENKDIKNIKRYIEKDSIEFTFYYKDNLYIAAYFININDFEISKIIK